MAKKHMRAADGKYHVAGKVYDLLKGSRTQVKNGTAYQTKGLLKKAQIKMNKWGKYVSVKKSKTAKRENKLFKLGFRTRKGHFGVVKTEAAKNYKKKSGKGTRRKGRKGRK